MTRAVGLLGGGVIGGGWAARFLLNGFDVVLYDPDPEAERKVAEMLENARRAYGRLTYAPLPPEGALTFAATVEEAHKNLMLTKALDLSAKRKQPVKLPLDPEEEKRAA